MPNKLLQSYSQDIAANPKVLAEILAGSWAVGFEKPGSDLDCYVIFKAGTAEREVEKFKEQMWAKYGTVDIDLSNRMAQTISEFKNHAKIGTPFDWDRYSFVHAQMIFDRSGGVVQKILDAKRELDPTEQRAAVQANLPAYISLSYRAVNSSKFGRKFASRLDAAESVQHLLVAWFALEGRVRPYNKYLEWELRNFPLRALKIPVERQLTLLVGIGSGKITDVLEMHRLMEQLARRKGYGRMYDIWGDKLKKGMR